MLLNPTFKIAAELKRARGAAMAELCLDPKYPQSPRGGRPGARPGDRDPAASQDAAALHGELHKELLNIHFAAFFEI